MMALSSGRGLEFMSARMSIEVHLVGGSCSCEVWHTNHVDDVHTNGDNRLSMGKDGLLRRRNNIRSYQSFVLVGRSTWMKEEYYMKPLLLRVDNWDCDLERFFSKFGIVINGFEREIGRNGSDNLHFLLLWIVFGMNQLWMESAMCVHISFKRCQQWTCWCWVVSLMMTTMGLWMGTSSTSINRMFEVRWLREKGWEGRGKYQQKKQLVHHHGRQFT